jgi:hypothetical protein
LLAAAERVIVMRTEMMRRTAAMSLLLLGCAAQKPATRSAPSSVSSVSQSTPPTNEQRSAVDEALTPRDVQVVVQKGIPAVRACYERNRNASGAEDKVVVHWVVGKNGKASDVRIEGTTFKTSEVGDCLIATIVSWTFPLPTQTVEVSFPFVFRASD